MRRSKEIVILFALLVGAMAFVLWYVIDRRARNRALPPVAARTLAPVPPDAAPAPVVDLTQHDGQTIDFSSGKPVVKNTPEDQAAMNAALKDMEAATKDVTFGPPPKPAEPAPAAKP